MVGGKKHKMTPRFLVSGDWVDNYANRSSNYRKANKFRVEFSFEYVQFQAPARYSRQNAIGQTRA